MVIAFVGGGNMATALIAGLVAGLGTGRGASANAALTIRVAEPNPEARSRLRAEFDITVCETALTAVRDADVVVSSGDRGYDEKLRRIAMGWRFRPARDAANRPVAYPFEVSLRF